jgi:hypothetical protein
MIVLNLGNRGSIDLNPGMKSRPQRLKAAILALLFRTTLSRALTRLAPQIPRLSSLCAAPKGANLLLLRNTPEGVP